MNDFQEQHPDAETPPTWELTCPRIRSGQALAGVLTGTSALNFDNDEPQIEDEATLIGQLYDDIQDWEVIESIGGHALVGARNEFTQQIDRLALRGLYVYAARVNEKRRSAAGQGKASDVPTAYIRVRRVELQQIILKREP